MLLVGHPVIFSCSEEKNEKFQEQKKIMRKKKKNLSTVHSRHFMHIIENSLLSQKAVVRNIYLIVNISSLKIQLLSEWSISE